MNKMLTQLKIFFCLQKNLGKKFIEIRYLKTANGVISGIFETTDKGAAALAAEVQRLGLEKSSMYHTINTLSDDYVKNFTNSLNKLHIKVKNVTKNSDISRLRLIMLDFDPKRNTNTSSTDVEKSKAYECMQNVLSELGTEHIAYTTDSGNGYNAYVLVDFPNDKEHNKLISDFIVHIHQRFSTEAVDVDLATKNPARIAKVCGSWSCKGDNTPERPHRMCKLLTTNTDSAPMTAEQISQYTEVNKPQKKADKQPKIKKVRVRDVGAWLDTYGLEYQVKDSEFDGKPTTMYLLKDCPFAEHDNKFCSFIVQFDDKSVIFKCHHDHCTQTIHDFIAKYPLPKQIPLINDDSEKATLYNAVVLNSKLLKNRNKQPHIMIDGKVIPFDSAECTKAISKIALTVDVLPSNSTMSTVQASIGALFDDFAQAVPIGTRIIHENDDYYYALTLSKFVHITGGKAEITDKTPMYFVYNPQFVEQIMPDLSSPAEDLPKLIDEVFSISSQNKLRFIVQICSFFLPNLPTPILVLSGGHGTSKTTTARKIISLVDPKPVDIMSIPDKEDGLTAILASNYISVLDNVAAISQTFSDILCIACTGGFTAKRKLYTDNTLVSAPLKSHVILNGIGDFINRPDLAERSNIIYLDPISKRLTEREVWDKFNKIKPQILGSIFNTIAKGLALVDSCEAVADLPRMADFAQYGVAFSKSIGLDSKFFVKDYQNTNTQLLAECGNADPFITAIVSFVHGQCGTWKGTATELLDALKSGGYGGFGTFVNFIPQTLSRKLNQSSGDLEALGVRVTFVKGETKYIALKAADNEISTGISTGEIAL